VKSVLRRAAAAVSAVLVAGLVAVPPAGAREAPGAAGSAGIGDPYFPRDGNGGYDVAHYDIHDSYRLRSGALRGHTAVSAVATEHLTSFDLDLMLTPDSVTVDGKRARFAKSGPHELVVTPASPIPSGRRFVARVSYHGVPKRLSYGGEKPFFAEKDEALAVNQPHIAPWWFPVNDHPRDKATYDVTVAVPRGNQVIGNGTLVSRRTTGAWTAYHWRMKQPMASYLAFFAAGRYRVESGVSHGLPWTVAVSKWFGPQAQVQQLRLMKASPGIVRWLSTQFGRYPFDSTGGVVTSLNTGFALENQSRPTYPFLGNGHEAHTTVVHELAHQWFGDDVSVQRWSDIWLNEGFATWAEWRYDETHGRTGAAARLQQQYSSHPASDPFWRLRIADPGHKRLFDVPVYDRGAMTVQALRNRIGTTDLLRVLRSWAAQHARSTGTVQEFEALAARVSGQDLGGFFDAWVRTGRRPAHTAANGLA
jgi:aminopeptidase N